MEVKGDYEAGEERPVIRFQAALARTQTMADGGIRFIFDCPGVEQSVQAQAQLTMCKIDGIYLDIECRAYNPEVIQIAEEESIESDDRQITIKEPKDRLEL